MNEKKRDIGKFTWRDIVIVVSYLPVQFLMSMILMIIFMAVAGSGAGLDSLISADGSVNMNNPVILQSQIWSLFFSNLVLGIVGMAMYWSYLKEQWQQFGQKWKRNILVIIIALLAVIVFQILFSMFVNSETSANQSSLINMFAALPMWQLILVQLSIVFFGPLVEELVCRKALFGSYKHIKIVNICMFILSSIFFGLLHYGWNGNFIEIIPYVFMGATMAGAYWYTNNFFTTVWLHILNNFIASGILVAGILFGVAI
jgi:Predicted metal-dependent membrane protease